MAKNTKELENALKNCEGFERYYTENSSDFSRETLTAALEKLLLKKKVKKSEVIRAAGISEVYGYQIFSGVRRPEREKLLRLLISMDTDLDELQKLLKTAGYPQLYVKIPRDCVIIYGVCNDLNVAQINDMLFEYGEALI